jgi:hypothetical protein
MPLRITLTCNMADNTPDAKSPEPCPGTPPQRSKLRLFAWLLPVALPFAVLYLLTEFTTILCCGCYAIRALVILGAAYVGIVIAKLIAGCDCSNES